MPDQPAVGIDALRGEIEALLGALEAERRRNRDELAFARRIQTNLMPTRAPELTGWQLATGYRPARIVGGDFYDHYVLPGRPGSLGFVVADVTGKGITAALMMAFTRAVLRAAAYNGSGPADALERTNRVLVRDARTGLFVTALVGELDTATGLLRYASAAHEPALVVRADGRASRPEALASTPAILGMFETPGFEEHTVRLEPADALVGYTDGVTDARNPSGARLGDDSLVIASAESGQAPDASAEGIVDGLLATLDAFTLGAEQADDITLLVVRRTTPGGPWPSG